jgi:hypothetical protein
LFGELQRFPISERYVSEILLGLPSWSEFLAGPRVVFPIDQTLGSSTNNAFCKNSADAIVFVLVDRSVWMGRGLGDRS